MYEHFTAPYHKNVCTVLRYFAPCTYAWRTEYSLARIRVLKMNKRFPRISACLRHLSSFQEKPKIGAAAPNFGWWSLQFLVDDSSIFCVMFSSLVSVLSDTAFCCPSYVFLLLLLSLFLPPSSRSFPVYICRIRYIRPVQIGYASFRRKLEKESLRS